MDAIKLRPYLIRLALVLAISLVGVAIFNEIVYLLQRDASDRAPTTVQIVIPDGTMKKVNAGEAVPSIPAEMTFVVGDVLEVKNEDSVDHQLGPVWVPAGSTGRLPMEQPDKLAVSCSFQPGRYLDIDIRQPTTFATRMTGLLLGVPTVAIFLYIYGLLVFPVKSKTILPSPLSPARDEGNKGD